MEIESKVQKKKSIFDKQYKPAGKNIIVKVQFTQQEVSKCLETNFSIFYTSTFIWCFDLLLPTENFAYQISSSEKIQF